MYSLLKSIFVLFCNFIIIISLWWQYISTDTVYLYNEYETWNLLFSHLFFFFFQGPRPSAFIIERTQDNGETWEPALYLATDCRRAFPGVPTSTPLRLDDTYCYTLPPTGNNPYQDHTVRTSSLLSLHLGPSLHIFSFGRLEYIIYRTNICTIKYN